MSPPPPMSSPVDYLEEHDLVTVPELCLEIWRMRMMSPERQKFTPFFTGGETVTDLATRVGDWWRTLDTGAHFLMAHAGVVHCLDVVAAGLSWEETVDIRLEGAVGVRQGPGQPDAAGLRRLAFRSDGLARSVDRFG